MEDRESLYEKPMYDAETMERLAQARKIARAESFNRSNKRKYEAHRG